jgi:hypothetical protein
MGAVVSTGIVGVPVQLAGPASNPNTAVAASAVPVVLLVLPYILPVLPLTVNWLSVMPLLVLDV